MLGCHKRPDGLSSSNGQIAPDPIIEVGSHGEFRGPPKTFDRRTCREDLLPVVTWAGRVASRG